MKNFKRIIAVITALAVMMSFGISAASAASFEDVSDSASYAEAVGLLTSFGIINGYGDGTFKPDNTITRAETAAIMVRALGRENEAESASGRTNYSDVAASHWASGYINVASNLGIIDGFPDGTFLPEENVTYEQIVKMIVCALGYEIKAQSNGGYPTGYISAASSAGVTKGISGYIGQEASRATVAKLVYNSLEIEMMEETSYSTGLYGVSYGTNGKTILNDKLNLEKVDAVVTDTYLTGETYSTRDKDISLSVTKVYGSASHVDSADYEKGYSYTFDAGDTDAAVYLGYAVTAYVGEDEDTGKEKIFAITPNSGRNTSVEIASNRLNEKDSSDKVISYLKTLTSSKYTELKLDSNYSLVVNGEIVSDSVKDYLTDADLLTLVDNDNDNTYEFLFVSVFTGNGEEFVVSDIDIDDELYYFEGDRGSFDADLDDDTVLYTVIRDGKIASFDDIDIGDVVTVLDSSRDIITVYVSSESLTGSIDEYDAYEDEYKIKNKIYTLSPAFAGSLDVGDYGTFYINYLGKIADSTVSSSVASGDYVFITNYDTDTAWNKTSYIIQAVTQTGAVMTYKVKSKKVKLIDTKGEVYKTLDDDDVYAYLLAEKNDLSDKYNVPGYAGVARVKVSSSGTLSEIYLPGSYADFYAQTKYASDNTKEYSARKEMYGTFDLSGKIAVFNIDKSEEDLVDAVEVGGVEDFFSDGSNYSFIAYGERNEDIEAIMITDGIATVNYEQHATIITKVSQITSNGERTVRYTGITDGVTKTYTVDPDDSFDVDRGNIVIIEVGSDGYISALELVAATTDDYNDLEIALDYGDIPSDDEADVYAGLVESKNTRTFTIQGVEDSFYNDPDASYTLIDYTGREATYASSNSSAIKVNNSTESFVVVRLYEDTVIDVFIFRMNTGTYTGGSSNIWDNIGYVEEPSQEASTEATEPSTEATEPSTEASTEATSPSTEATSPSTEATSPSSEATSPSAEASQPSSEATSPSAEASQPSSESGTVNLSGATEAPTSPATLPTQATTEAPTEPATLPTQATTEAPTETATLPTQATTEAPTSPATLPTQATTEAPTAPTSVPTQATAALIEPATVSVQTGTEAPTASATLPTSEAETTAAQEPTEKSAEPTTEATTEAPTEPSTAPTSPATLPTEATAATSPSEATTAPSEPATNAVKTDSSLAKAVLDLVNAERAKANLPALKWNAALAKVAESHSIEMATYSQLSHTSKDGSTFAARIENAGISYKVAAENVAWNQRTAKAVVESWMNSPLHKANILNSGYTEMGAGLAIAADGSYYWTQNFIG